MDDNGERIARASAKLRGMILRGLTALIIIAGLLAPAAALERVSVGTQRLTANGALFLAAVNGYFKAEGIELVMTAYPSEQAVVDTLKLNAHDFGLMAFSPAAFNLAGTGAIKAVAAQLREKREHEGHQLIASNAAYAKGLRKPEDLVNKVVAISQIGSVYHYQLGQIARVKRFDLAGVTLKPMQTLEAVARAVAQGQADAAILPAQDARPLLTTSQAKLVVWYSELDEQQLGALFVTAKTLAARRATVEKFLRAYRRGATDYAGALLRRDRYAKRIVDAKSQSAAAAIARYAYPGQAAGGADKVEAAVYYMDAQARLDMADLTRQVDWYKAQGLVDKTVDARAVVDLSFNQ